MQTKEFKINLLFWTRHITLTLITLNILGSYDAISKAIKYLKNKSTPGYDKITYSQNQN